MNLQKFRYITIDAETLIYIIIFGMMAIQFALPFRVYSIVSLGTWCIFFSSVFAFILRIIRGIDKNVFSVIVLAIILFISMICSFSVSYENFTSAFSFLEIPLIICAYPKLKNSRRIRKLLYGCYSLLAVLYIVLSFMSISNIYYDEYGEKYMDFMTLGYNNPNQIAMYLFINIIVLGILFFDSKKIITKIFSAIMICILVALVLGTLSRTSFVVSVFYIIGLVYFRKKRIPSALRIASFVIPIAFFFLTIVFHKLMSSLMLFGEKIETGRFEIYVNFLKELDLIRFLFGWYPFQFNNLHNAFLTIFSTAGLLGLGIYIEFLNSKLRYLQSCQRKNGAEKYSVFGLCCILIYMSAESAIMVSGGAFAVMFVSVYLLGISGDKVDSKPFLD